MEYTEAVAQAFEIVKNAVVADERLTGKETQSMVFDLCWVENKLKGE